MRSPLPTDARPWRLSWLLLFYALVLPAGQVHAAGPTVTNLLSNGGFEKSTQTADNLWDGVDGDGYLAGFKHSAQVITDRGSFGSLAMPPSVAFVDLNGDGKPDLLVADPTGYFHYYPNSGTATAPHFTSAELLPIFLSTTFRPRPHDWVLVATEAQRFCPRFALADWRHTGLLDLLIGNYYGEVLFLPNVGTAKQPVFRQPGGPEGVSSARLPTSAKEPFWGNLLSPAAADFDHRGHLDLVLGEGTYSANSIHLLRNGNTAGLPKFSDADHTHIAYGDGREQLIPTVVDFDGDGNPDILVADRTGEVGVYLNPGKSQPPGAEFKRAATISFGGRTKLPGLCSIYAADFNGDSLFDLILGSSTGRIAVALNTGKVGQPAFGPIQELKGEDRLLRNIHVPDGWSLSTHPEYGNALAYFSVVDATEDPASQPPEGTHCLKGGYWPLPGNTFQLPSEGMPGALRRFDLTRSGLTLNNNKSYELSFRVKASGMEKLHYNFHSRFEGPSPLAKLERGERGELKNREDFIIEDTDLEGNFSAGSNWSAVSVTLNVKYRSKDLQDRPTMTGSLHIESEATSMASVIYFDDFKLVPK